MLNRSSLHIGIGTLICLLASLALHADLLGSIDYPFVGAGIDVEGPPPALATFFLTISPSLGGPGPFPTHPCAGGFGPFTPALGQPCFPVIQVNVVPSDVGKSFVIDATTNSDFATITFLMQVESFWSLSGLSYPAGIVPTFPASFAPPGSLNNVGSAGFVPGFTGITQLQFTLTSLCISNNGACFPGGLEQISYSATLDVYRESVPEPLTFMLVASPILLLLITPFRKWAPRADRNEV